MNLPRIIQALSEPLPFPNSYAAGFDAGQNGSNRSNSHFRFFNSKEAAKDWDRGHADGQRARELNKLYQEGR